MSPKEPVKLQYSFEFEYTLTTQGVPQPYPVDSPGAKVLFRISSAEDENDREFSVLNICGNRKGLEYLAAMLLLCGNSEQHDPFFHIHLEDREGFETDMDVTIRAPSYFDALDKREFSEAKGTPIQPPPPRRRKSSSKRQTS